MPRFLITLLALAFCAAETAGKAGCDHVCTSTQCFDLGQEFLHRCSHCDDEKACSPLIDGWEQALKALDVALAERERKEKRRERDETIREEKQGAYEQQWLGWVNGLIELMIPTPVPTPIAEETLPTPVPTPIAEETLPTPVSTPIAEETQIALQGNKAKLLGPIDRQIFCVGPIWNDHEARRKAESWMKLHKPEQRWIFTGEWRSYRIMKSDHPSSYCVFNNSGIHPYDIVGGSDSWPKYLTPYPTAYPLAPRRIKSTTSVHPTAFPTTVTPRDGSHIRSAKVQENKELVTSTHRRLGAGAAGVAMNQAMGAAGVAMGKKILRRLQALSPFEQGILPIFGSAQGPTDRPLVDQLAVGARPKSDAERILKNALRADPDENDPM
jgi:hypothetical protein